MVSCSVYSSEVAWQESPNTPTENRNYYQFFPKKPVDQQSAHMGSSGLVVYDNERETFKKKYLVRTQARAIVSKSRARGLAL